MKTKDNIAIKDESIDQKIYEIFNSAYHEFVKKYGDKYSDRIKSSLENMINRVTKVEAYYSAPVASAHKRYGVLYTDSEDLSPILKHELWHVYNDYSNGEKSFEYMPDRYKEVLKNKGVLKREYDEQVEEYKERFKKNPDILNRMLIDYDKFIEEYSADVCEVEKWTEWFNTQTHIQDMKDYFWDWCEGFFTKSKSSNSFYDAYIGISSMVSCLIPKEKLLDMYMQTDDFKTDYSYPELLEEFDKLYEKSMDEEDKEYKYPYLKLIMDTKVIDRNARKNPKLALETLQSVMKTCFNAYYEKLSRIENLDIEQAKEIYSEIKFMQCQMPWNVDINKLENLDYIKSLNKVQNKFKDMIQKLSVDEPDIKKMYENVEYTKDNPFKLISGGEEIIKIISNSSQKQDEKLVDVDKYKILASQGDVKNNLYNTLFTLLDCEKYNLIFENYKEKNSFDENKNILVDIHDKIKEAKTENDVLNIYNEIYSMFEEKISKELDTDRNIKHEFIRYSKKIVELQKDAPFNVNRQEYLPILEEVINKFNEKVNEFKTKIDIVSDGIIEKRVQNGEELEFVAEVVKKQANMTKEDIAENTITVRKQKEYEINRYKELTQSNRVETEHAVLPIANNFKDSLKNIAVNTRMSELQDAEKEIIDIIEERNNLTKSLE